jgi:hypothetical protein
MAHTYRVELEKRIQEYIRDGVFVDRFNRHVGVEGMGERSLKAIAWVYENPDLWKLYFTFADIYRMAGLLEESVNLGDEVADRAGIRVAMFLTGGGYALPSLFELVIVFAENGSEERKCVLSPFLADSALHDEEFFYPYTGVVAESVKNNLYPYFRVSSGVQKDIGKFI